MLHPSRPVRSGLFFLGWHWFRGLFFVLLLGLLAAAAGPVPASGEEDPIITNYLKAIQVDPQDAVAHFNLGLAYYKLKRWEEARHVLEKAVSLNSRNTAVRAQVDGPAYQLLGIIAYNHAQDDARAIDYFKRSLQTMPQDGDNHYFLGLAYARRKDHAAAVMAFQAAMEKGRRDPDLYTRLGRSLLESRQEKEAIAAYEQALALQPQDQAALEDLALIYHQKKDSDKTIAVLERLVAVDPMNFNANYLLGLHYYQKKHYWEMVAAYNRAVAVKPDLADAHYNLGMAYYFMGRYDQAVEALKKVVTLNPGDAEAYNLLGQAQTAAVETHLQQGSSYIAQDRLHEAAVEFHKVLSIDPGHHKAKVLLEDCEAKIAEMYAAHMRLAEKFVAENRLEEAYNEYELAFRILPDSLEAKSGMQKARVRIDHMVGQRLARGKAAEKIKDYREAREYYAAALSLKPDCTAAQEALRNLEAILSRQVSAACQSADRNYASGKLRAAAVEYRQVLKLADNLKQPEPWQTKAANALTQIQTRLAEQIRSLLEEGKAAVQAGETDHAKRAFNQVLEIEPQNKTANDYIVRLTGSQSQAQAQAELIKATYYQGVDFYVKGKVEEAIREWEKVIQLDPDNQDARINIERANAKLIAIRKLTQGQ